MGGLDRRLHQECQISRQTFTSSRISCSAKTCRFSLPYIFHDRGNNDCIEYCIHEKSPVNKSRMINGLFDHVLLSRTFHIPHFRSRALLNLNEIRILDIFHNDSHRSNTHTPQYGYHFMDNKSVSVWIYVSIHKKTNCRNGFICSIIFSLLIVIGWSWENWFEIFRMRIFEDSFLQPKWKGISYGNFENFYKN